MTTKRTRSVILFLTLIVMAAASVAQEKPRETLPPVDSPYPAPDFELQGEDGKTYKLSDFRGQVVVLNFWATWCPPCRFEMPSMESAWQMLEGKGVMFLGVNVGEDEDTIFEFTGEYPLSFPLPMDRDGSVIKAYDVVGLPTTYVIDPKGRVTHRAVGSRYWDGAHIVDALRALLKNN